MTGIDEAIDRALGRPADDHDGRVDLSLPGDEAFWSLLLEVRDSLESRGVRPVSTRRAEPDRPEESWHSDDLPDCWPLQLFAVTPDGQAWTYEVDAPADFHDGRPGTIHLNHPQRLFEGGIDWDAERGITYTAPTGPNDAPPPPGMTDDFWRRITSGGFGDHGYGLPIRDLLGVAVTYLL